MKIAFLKRHLSNIGGLEKYTKKLIQAFYERGLDVTILTQDPPSPCNMAQIVQVAKPKGSFYNLFHFDHACQRWLKENRHDIIFGIERTTPQTHLRAGNGVHKVFLERRELIDSKWKSFTFKFNPRHRAVLSLEKRGFESRNLKRLFTNSHMVKEEVLENFSIDPSKIEVVHNGVEWHAFEKPFLTSLEKERSSSYEFLFVGNDYKRKGLPFLLKGLSLIKEENFHLSIVGAEKNPSYFKEMASSLHLSKKVTFYGKQVEILPFYERADCLVLPSIYDPFANVTVEALAMGLYVVTSLYNGGHEVLNEQSGTKILELHSMKEALLEALNHKKTKDEAMLRRVSIKELDFSHQLNKIVEKTLQ